MESVALSPKRYVFIFGLKEKLILLLIVSAVSVVAGQFFEDTISRVTPEEGIFHSVINKRPSGLSALLAITDQSGLPCTLWSLPYKKLPAIKGSLYVIQPKIVWSDNQLKDILAWVKQGNQLIYFDTFSQNLGNWNEDHPNKKQKINNINLLQKLGLSAEWLDNRAVIYDRTLPEMAHVNKLLLKTHVKILGGQPLVACNNGAYITSVKHGAGRVIVGTVPELCANGMLGKTSNYDNFQFMINCFRANNGIVIFDEYCHGFKEHNNVLVYFSRRLPGLICFQLLLMLLAFELTSGQRFGAKKILQVKRKISDLAYVSGLANVYKRAQANLVALEIIVGFWKARLCRHLGLSARASTEEILTRAKDYSDMGQLGATKQAKTESKVKWIGDLQRFLTEYELTLAQGQINKTRLTELIKQCDSLIRGMR